MDKNDIVNFKTHDNLQCNYLKIAIIYIVHKIPLSIRLIFFLTYYRLVLKYETFASLSKAYNNITKYFQWMSFLSYPILLSLQYMCLNNTKNNLINTVNDRNKSSFLKKHLLESTNKLIVYFLLKPKLVSKKSFQNSNCAKSI